MLATLGPEGLSLDEDLNLFLTDPLHNTHRKVGTPTSDYGVYLHVCRHDGYAKFVREVYEGCILGPYFQLFFTIFGVNQFFQRVNRNNFKLKRSRKYHEKRE